MFPRRTHLSFAVYVALSVSFLLLGLLWLLTSATSTRAQSQPEALGSISGVIRNAQGDPLPNMTVWLEHYQGIVPSRQTTSNAEGQYQFFSVMSGNYWLRFEDAGKNYAPAYYMDAIFAEDADLVTVNGNNVTGIDMELQAGGSISVTLQDAFAMTYTTHIVQLYRRAETGHWLRYLYTYTEQGKSSILLPVIPAGSYRLCIRSNSNFFWTAEECYDDVLPEQYDQVAPNANDIAVAAGEETRLTLTVNDQPQLEGYLLDPNDQPLANFKLELRTFGVFGGGYPGLYATTNEDGYFRFGFIPKGEYKLVFNSGQYGYGSNSQYLKVYYPNEVSSANAQAVSIGPTTHMSINKKLTPSATISGKATLPTDVPLSNVSFLVYRLRQDNVWAMPYDCYEDCPTIGYDYLTGVYSVTQLAAGKYRVAMNYYLPNAQSGLTQFYGGTSFETADDLVLATGETKGNINFTVGSDNFDGGVSGRVTANGQPKADIEVGIFSPNNYSPDSLHLPMVQTKTNAQGEYRIEGLTTGYYMVGFRDPTGLYATTFYTGQQELYGPDMINITQTSILENVDVVLSSPGATIQGHVYTEQGKQPSGFSVQIQRKLPFDPYYTMPVRFTEAKTDVNGFFELTGLPAGTYYILATAPSRSAEYPYRTVRYYPTAPDIYSAQLITVTTGQTQDGRNIYFAARPAYFLPLVGSGQPAPAEAPNPTPTVNPFSTPTIWPTPTATPIFNGTATP